MPNRAAWILAVLFVIFFFSPRPATAQDAVLSGFTVTPGSIVAGSTQTATATVTIIRLTCQDCGIAVPVTPDKTWALSGWSGPNMSVPAFSNSVSQTFQSSFVSSDTLVTFTASLGGATLAQTLNVTAPIVGLSISPGSAVGLSNQTATGTVTLNAASQFGASVTLAAGVGQPQVATFPNSASIAAGASSGTFVLTPLGVSAPTTMTVTATYGTSASANFTSLPHTLAISINPSSLFNGGPPASATATISPAFPATSTVGVTMTASPNGFLALNAPSFSGGATSAAFTIFQTNVTDPTTFTITSSTAYSNTVINTINQYPNRTDMGPCAHCEQNAGSPINLISGNVWIQQRDYSLPGLGGGIEILRTWNSLWQNSSPVSTNGMFGHSWRSTYEERFTFPDANTVVYWRADGNPWYFSYDSTMKIYSLVSPPDQRLNLQFDAGTTLYTLTFLDGTKHIFNNSGYLTAGKDRNGNQTTVTYDTSNRITTLTDAGSRSVTFAYANANFPLLATTAQDSVGTFATYTYDTSGRLTQVQHADLSQINYAYDASNQITSVTDANAKVLETHTYDSFRRGLTSARANGADAITVTYNAGGQTTLTDSLGNATTYNSNYVSGQGLITSITGSGCASCGGRGNSTFVYDASGNRTSSTDANGNTTTLTYDASANVTSRSIQVGGSTLTWSFTYNGLGEVLTSTDPLGHTTTNTYNTSGNLLTTTTPSPDGSAPGSATTFTYDAKGQLTKITDPRSNGTTIAYTPAGLISSITDAQNNVTSFAYDARGNRTSATDANNQTTTFAYDSMNRVTKITYVDLTTTQFAYDTRGRRTSVTDQNGKTTTYAYDDADRLTSVKDAALNTTTYSYDSENNLTGITDAANHTTSFAYDALGHVTKTTFPSTLSETYGYDGVGDLTSKTDRKGQTITYTYDPLNRLTKKAYPDTTSVAYTYDNASRLTQVSDPTGTYSFTFDNLGRLTGTTTSYSFLPGRTLTTSYAYDAASNRTSFTDPESGLTTYAYDALNRLANLTDFQSHPFTFSYDALSRRTQMTRANGVNTTYSYDALSRLLSVTHKKATTTFDGAGYTVDAAGNRTSRSKLPDPTLTTYSYDALYQLTLAVQGTTTKESYTYDAVGNRLTSLGSAAWSYNASNELTSKPGVTYTYDNNGNLVTKAASAGTTTYAWDFENRLSSVTLPGTGGTVSFKYDAFGRRIYKSSSSGTSIFAYDGDNVIEEVSSTGSAVARYTQGLGMDEPLGMVRGTTTSYYEADGLGSITSATDSGGVAAATYAYDGFGNATNLTGTLTNPFRYTARELDSETGLYYYRARYYDQQTGRFINEDFLRLTDGLNRYSYALNSPVNYFDPLGLCPWEVRTRPLRLPKGLKGPAGALTPKDNPPTHAYFNNTQTGETVGLGPLNDTAGNSYYGPGTWLPPEHPGSTKGDNSLGVVPDDICDCVDKRIKNRGRAPNYCTAGPNLLQPPCMNCWNWVLQVVGACREEQKRRNSH